MGLFDIFKKKEVPAPQPVRNNPNSVFTLRFTIPYFQIFDKTAPELSALPIKMSVTGSCQYRIGEPDLCFDNTPLGEMTPEQLESHVKDALTMNIKSLFNSIESIPVLQFESKIVQISEITKARIIPIFNDEFGINLRTFNITGVRYDTEDQNYLRLQAVSQKILEGRTKKVEALTDAELETIKSDTELSARTKKANADFELDRKRKEHALELERQRSEHDLELQGKRNDLKAIETEREMLRKQKEVEIELQRLQKEKELDAALSDKDAARLREDKEHALELELKRLDADTARKKAEKNIDVCSSQMKGIPSSQNESVDDYTLVNLDNDLKL